MAYPPYRIVGRTENGLIAEYKNGARYEIPAPPEPLPKRVRLQIEAMVREEIDDGVLGPSYRVTLTDSKLKLVVTGEGYDRSDAITNAEVEYRKRAAALAAVEAGSVTDDDDDDEFAVDDDGRLVNNAKGKKIYYDEYGPDVSSGVVKAKAVNLPLMLRRGLKKLGASTYAVSKSTGIPGVTLSRFKSGKSDLSAKNCGKLMGVLGMRVITVHKTRLVWAATGHDDKRVRRKLVESNA